MSLLVAQLACLISALALGTAMACLVGLTRRAERDLARFAHLDALTGLPDRQAFAERAALEEERCLKRRPTGLILLDIDHFRRVNEEHGHQVGDRVLQAASALASELLPGELYRIGGQEFVALLPQSSMQATQAAAEALRARVAESALDTDDGPLQVTLSLGISLLRPGSTWSESLQAADRALHAAKEGGRNCIYSALPVPLTATLGSGRPTLVSCAPPTSPAATSSSS